LKTIRVFYNLTTLINSTQMKKSLTLLLAFMTLGLLGQAQRQIDWSTESIEEPSELRSTSTGTAIPVFAVLKNNGTDTVKAGDSLFRQVLVLTTSNGVLIGYPSNNPNQFNIQVMDRTVAPGDTMHMRIPGLRTTAIVNSSADVKLRVTTLMLNRGAVDPIAGEDQAGLTNNFAEKNMVWFNQQGWGVSVEEVALDDIIKISPNPATTEVNLKWLIGTPASVKAKVQIYDLAGKLVVDQTMEGIGTESIDVSSLKQGVYMVRVTNGDFTTTKKLQIAN
jgi:hypothetical protein